MNNRSTTIAGLLIFAISTLCAQLPPPPADAPPVVEVVGCLSQSGSNWTLAKATETAPATTTFTTPEALKSAAEKPLGTQQYHLLGTKPYGPANHKGHKVVVKGILIKSGGESRINLTSFQMLAETCAK